MVFLFFSFLIFALSIIEEVDKLQLAKDTQNQDENIAQDQQYQWVGDMEYES